MRGGVFSKKAGSQDHFGLAFLFLASLALVTRAYLIKPSYYTSIDSTLVKKQKWLVFRHRPRLSLEDASAQEWGHNIKFSTLSMHPPSYFIGIFHPAFRDFCFLLLENSEKDCSAAGSCAHYHYCTVPSTTLSIDTSRSSTVIINTH